MTAHSSELNKVLEYLRDEHDDTQKTILNVLYDKNASVFESQKEKVTLLQDKLLKDQNIKIISRRGPFTEEFPYIDLTHQGFDFIQSGGYSFYLSVSNNIQRGQRMNRIRLLITIITGLLSIILLYIAVQKVKEIRTLEKENELLKIELRGRK